MRVVPVPCLKDNYAYLVVDERSRTCAVVDPGEAQPVRDAIAREGVKLAAVWLTHHHWDHVGGAAELATEGVEVVIGEVDRDKAKLGAIAARTVRDGDPFVLAGLHFTAIHNPGHTLGATSIFGEGCVFTGDTLFSAGCGRVFEGDHAMMHASLQRLAALPPETLVYFGHEYTAANLKFAAAAEPGNIAIAQRTQRLATPSTPSTIAIEREINPFVRADSVEKFAELREWKNTF